MFKEFKKGQKKFGEDIAIIINSILLSFVYFVGVGLTSIFAKVFRKNFLELKPDKKIKSYWVDLKLKNNLEDYYKQF